MKQYDMRIVDIGKMRIELEDQINTLIQKFSNDTGLIVDEVDINEYAKRNKDGSVTTISPKVELIIRL
jgi:hypothetical protein